LVGPPAVDVDLWQFRRLMDGADGASLRPDSLERLLDAIALWRGDPIADLESVVALDADLEHVRAELVDGCLRLGEQLLAIGQFRQAIAALIQRRDRDALGHRVRALAAMLDDLGIEPEPATAMLLARAGEVLGEQGHRVGPQSPPSRAPT
jgi:hypothetical protein